MPAASLLAAVLDGFTPNGAVWHACQPCHWYIRAHVTQRVALVFLGADDTSRRAASMWFAAIGRRPRAYRAALPIGSRAPRFRRSADSSVSPAVRRLRAETFFKNLTEHLYNRDLQRDVSQLTLASVIFARSSTRSADRRATHFKRSAGPSPTSPLVAQFETGPLQFLAHSRARRAASSSGS